MGKSLRRTNQIVILGAGIGAFRIIRDLQNVDHDFSITLIDSNDQWIDHSTLTEHIRGTSLSPRTLPIVDALHGTDVAFVQAAVDKIDVRKGVIHLHFKGSIAFDQLIVAYESSPLKTNTWSATILPLETPADAKRIWMEVQEEFTIVSQHGVSHTPKDGRLLIVGSGQKAIEVTAILGHFQRSLLGRRQSLPRAIPIELLPFPNASVFLETTPSARELLENRLTELGITVLPGRGKDQKKSVDELIRSFTKISHRNTPVKIIWAAPMTLGMPKLFPSFLLDGAHRLVVDQYLRAVHHERVWVLGSLAATAQGQVVHQIIEQADCVVENLLRQHRGKHLRAYEPSNLWLVIYLGGHQALLQTGSMAFYGIIGDLYRRWMLWVLPLRIFPWYRALRVMFGRIHTTE